MISEAIRNLQSRPALSLFMAFSMTAILGGSSVGVLMLTAKAFERQAALQDAGYLTFRIERDDDFGGQLHSDDCEALSINDSVVASTWIGAEEELRLLDFPGPPLRTTPVGESIDDVLAAVAIHAPPSDLIIGVDSSFASLSTLSLIDATGGSENRTVAPAELGSLGSALADSALIRDPSRSGLVDACVGVADIGARAIGLATVRLGFPPEAGYSAYYILDLPEQVETPLEQLEVSRRRRYPELVALLATALWLLYLRLRRAEMVFYSLAGLSRWRLFMVFEMELAVLLFPVAVLCIAVARRGLDLPFYQNHAVAGMAFFLLQTMTLVVVWMSALLATQIAYISGRATQVLKDG